MQRVCKICKKSKNLELFARNGKYYKYRCKACEAERVFILIKQTSDYVSSLKVKCEICGYCKNKKALEFHHIEGEDKDLTISKLANSRIWSLKTKALIDNEIKKCKCVCANCHREIHHPEENMAGS